MGESKGFRSNYFFFTNWRPGIGLGVDLRYKTYKFDQFQNHKLLSSFDLSYYSADVVFQTIFSNSFDIGGMIQGQVIKLDPKLSPNIINNNGSNTQYFNLLGYIKYDSYDRTVFPRKGLNFYAEAKEISTYFSGKSKDKKISFQRYMIYYSRRLEMSKKNILSIELISGLIHGENIPPEHLFYFGGFRQMETHMFSFQGLDFMGVPAKNLIISKLGFQMEIKSNHFFIMDLNSGKAKNKYKNLFQKDDFIFGFGLTYGIHTPIGPMLFKIMTNDKDKELKSYISFGYWF
jgi:NTE family protein